MKRSGNRPNGYLGDDDDEEEIEGVLSGGSPLFEAIKRHIRQQYRPTNDYPEALKLTTSELHSRLTMLFPSTELAPDALVEWLYSEGYTFYDEGGMKFVWLFGRV